MHCEALCVVKALTLNNTIIYLLTKRTEELKTSPVKVKLCVLMAYNTTLREKSQFSIRTIIDDAYLSTLKSYSESDVILLSGIRLLSFK